MDINTYWKRQQNISRIVCQGAVDYLKGSFHIPKNLRLLTEIVEGHGHRSSVRVTMLCLAYEAFSRRSWEEIGDVAVAVELEIASLYHLNRVLDGKGGIKQERLGEQIIIAGYLRNAAQRCFSEAIVRLKKENDPYLRSSFMDIDREVHNGWMREKYALTKDILTRQWVNQWEAYEERCSDVNAHFFSEICTIAAKLAGDPNTHDENQAMDTFGYQYGMALQMLNDLADFVPPEDNAGTVEKLPDDSWADLRNGIVTAPILFGWEDGSQECRRLIQKSSQYGGLSPAECLSLTVLLVREGHIGKVQKEIADCAKRARKALRVFPKERRAPLSTMLVLFDTNRYYKALEKYRE